MKIYENHKTSPSANCFCWVTRKERFRYSEDGGKSSMSICIKMGYMDMIWSKIL